MVYDKDFAALADNVYDLNKGVSPPQGYVLEKYVENKESGFAGAIYRNILTGELTVSYRGTDLVISMLGAESKITVKNFYNSTFTSFNYYHTIDSIDFMDGSKIGKSVFLTAKELMKGMYMPEEDLDGNILSDDDLIDTIILVNDINEDEIEENDSDTDEIVEVVITEEDFIALEENGFTFLMSNSHGNVDIENGDLVFNSEVTTSNLWMKNVDGDLIINVLGTDEEIVVQNWFNGEHGINNIITSDGVEISSDQIENFVNQMSQFGQPEDPTQVPPQINQMWESL